MIRSGWILPDMYEVSCPSCSNSSGHIQMVELYLEQLKYRKPKLYDDISLLLSNARQSMPALSMDDFAVIYLGWIKINSAPIKMIFYSLNNPLDFLVQKYLKYGYQEVVLQEHKPVFKVPIPSNQLI